jgi:hypothetical protein
LIHLLLLFLRALNGNFGCLEPSQQCYQFTYLTLAALRKDVKTVPWSISIKTAILEMKHTQKHNLSSGLIWL